MTGSSLLEEHSYGGKVADENNNDNGQFVPDGSMEPLSPQEADNTDYGLMDGERIQVRDLQTEMRE